MQASVDSGVPLGMKLKYKIRFEKTTKPTKPSCEKCAKLSERARSLVFRVNSLIMLGETCCCSKNQVVSLYTVHLNANVYF